MQSLLLEQIKEKYPDLLQIADAEIKKLFTATGSVLIEANEMKDVKIDIFKVLLRQM